MLAAMLCFFAPAVLQAEGHEALVKSAAVQQQDTKTVTGTVLDAAGEPVVGATIVERGTSNGTVTDVNGKFSIQLSSGSWLTVSYVGYTSQDVKPVGSSVSVTLQEDQENLDEVIVVGYGTQKKKDLTGSITSLDTKMIAVQNQSSVSKVLEGSIPGVNIASIDGQPGVDTGIRIRGVGSTNVASSGALVVIDGVAAQNDNPLSQLSPNDIATVTVLKDAASTAIYGARGANGVILITTKRGESGKPLISFTGKVGWNSTAGFDVGAIDDAATYYEYVWKSIYNSYRYGVNGTGGPQKDANGNWVTNVGSPNVDASAAGLFASQHLFDYIGSSTDFGVNALGNYLAYDVPGAQYHVTGTSSSMSGAYLIDPETGRLNPNARLLYDDTYADYLLSNKFRQEYNLSASGGNEKMDYYLSLNYMTDKSPLPQSGFKRINGRAKVNARLLSWLKVGANVGFTRTNTDYQASNTWQTRNAGASSGNYMQFIAGSPILPVYARDLQGNLRYNADGTPMVNYNKQNCSLSPLGEVGNNDYGVNYANRDVPYLIAHDKRGDLTTTWTSRLSLEIPFLKHFLWRTNFSYDKINNTTTRYMNAHTGRNAGSGGTLLKEMYDRHVMNIQNQLSYVQDFGKHHVDAMALFEYNDWENEMVRWSAAHEFIPDFFAGSNFVSRYASGSGFSNDGYGHDIERMASWLGRANYVYAEKYYASASIRYDGSSKFKKPEDRWGTFWSVGAGWRFSEEPFMQNTKGWLTNGKLRASYGAIGNQNAIGRYSGYRIWNYGVSKWTNVANGGYTGTPSVYSLSVGGLVNDALTWEVTHTFDVGLDLTFLDRIDVTIDWYNRLTGNSFFNMPVSYAAVGQATLQQNAAKIRNQGVEVDINASIIRNSNWSWNVGLNFTHYTTVLQSLPQEIVDGLQAEPYLPKGTWLDGGESWSAAGGSGNTGDKFYLRGVGKDWYNIYINRYAGVDQKTGLPMYYHRVSAEDVEARTYGDAKVGDAVPTTDYTKSSKWECGSAIPDIIGGFNTTLSYKGWTLSANLAFQLGGKFYSQEYAQNLYKVSGSPGGSGISFADRLVSKDVVGNTWTPENTGAKFPMQWYPTATTTFFSGTSAKGQDWQFTDIALFSASYLRIKNISLSYTVPQRFLRAIRLDAISKLRLFFSGDNLALWSAAKGIDPSMSASGGYEVGAFVYPNIRTFMFGVNVDF